MVPRQRENDQSYVEVYTGCTVSSARTRADDRESPHGDVLTLSHTRVAHLSVPAGTCEPHT
jgi:hypothetical protein